MRNFETRLAALIALLTDPTDNAPESVRRDRVDAAART
jgi:hypothetical protein